jgi:hypothetical protein
MQRLEREDSGQELRYKHPDSIEETTSINLRYATPMNALLLNLLRITRSTHDGSIDAQRHSLPRVRMLRE